VKRASRVLLWLAVRLACQWLPCRRLACRCNRLPLYLQVLTRI